MNKFGFNWPENLACDTFPVGGDPNRLCVGDTEGGSEMSMGNSQNVLPQQPYNPASLDGDVDTGIVGKKWEPRNPVPGPFSAKIRKVNQNSESRREFGK